MPMTLRERKRPVEPLPIKKRAPKKTKKTLDEAKVAEGKKAEPTEPDEKAETPVPEKVTDAEEKKDEAEKPTELETATKEEANTKEEASTKEEADTKKTEDTEKPKENGAKEAEKAEEKKESTEDKADEIKKDESEPAKADETSAPESDEPAVFEVGKPFPPISLPGEDEKMVDLRKVSEENGFVLFVYPRANTPGCTKQACGFRDNFKSITDAGYKVFGISADKPSAQMNFKTKQNLPYTLLADPTSKALKTLGVAKGAKSAIRSHVVVAKGGLVADIQIGVSPGDSVSKAVAFITKS